MLSDSEEVLESILLCNTGDFPKLLELSDEDRMWITSLVNKVARQYAIKVLEDILDECK